MGTFTQSIAVQCTAAGTPLRLEWKGRVYVVAADPVRWYERRKWWAEEARAVRGQGAGLVDQEIWRVQVRLEKARRAPLVTVDLAHRADSGRWQLIRVHDAAAQQLRESA
ncbi:DUF6504 family protein [Citricoccus nitrophenolicus]|uniref:DUF6504 family protein n=1 Tax=Citricoccus nitrophenolicus TaxID=863575 RepID=UPI003618125E